MSSSLQAHCPQCQSVFTVSEEQMRIAAGQVRCGKCLQVFNANTGEVDFVAPSVSTDSLEPESQDDQSGESRLAELSVAPMSHAELPTEDAPAPKALKYLTILLIVLLLAQAGWIWQADRAQQVSPVSVSQLLVRQHPELDNAVQLNAVLFNTSARAQPYPDLLLRFSSRYGEPQAQRRFSAREYLRDPGASAQFLAPQTRVQVDMSLRNPGRGAINYGLIVKAPAAMEN